MALKLTLTVIAAAVILIALYLYFDSRSPKPESSQPNTFQATPPPPTSESASPASLKIETEKQGTGPGAVAGDKITVDYTGMLTDDTVFDSSIPRGQPFVFTLGAGAVIRGWDQGLLGMKVGEKRKLTIPPELGYGAQGTPGGPIGPNATLIFEVEMLKIN